jgi:RHS repeat-associated protein
VHGNRELTYLYAGGTPFAIHEKNGEDEALYYLHLDYQGSIRAISNEQGNIVEQRDYDAWGRPRNPVTLNYTAANPFTHSLNTAIITSRGYTFHEHIFEFSLINMNARMYDPVTRRVISPDNYIQAPDYTQSFNRYSYCWNNPLKYTDPSGDLVEALIVATAGFTVGYLHHGLTTGDWGKDALIAGGITAAVATIGFYSGGTAAATAKSALTYSGKFAANTAINSVMPPMQVQVGNVGISMGIGVGFGSAGFGATATAGITYSNGDFSIGAGFGGNDNMLAWRGNASYKGHGASFGRTYYGAEIGPDGVSNPQTVGQVGIQSGKFSFRIENDFMGDGHDRWRSNAATIGWGNWEIGTNLRNNLQTEGIDEVDDFGEDLRGNINQDFKGDRYGKWKNGQTYSSPFWIGYRSGGNVTRVGYSHPMAQSLTQDVTHKHGFFGMPFGHANFFSNYNHFKRGGYSYSGYNNPYSLW